MKTGLQYEEKKLTVYNGNKILEVQAITVKMKHSTIDIINIYNPKTTLKEREFQHYMSQISNNYIMVGDFNGHHHMWDPERNGNPNPCGRKLQEIILNSNNIAIATTPSLPTYTNSYTGESSTLDLLLCTPRLIPYIETKTTRGLGSDHEPILSTITLEPDIAERGKRPKWILEKKNFNEWREELRTMPAAVRDELNEQQKLFTKEIIDTSNNHFKKIKQQGKIQIQQTMVERRMCQSNSTQKKSTKKNEKAANS